MKKKLFLFGLIALCLLTICNFSVGSNTSYAASTNPSAMFEISNAGQQIKIQNSDLQVDEQAGTWAEALSVISQQSGGEEVLINFNNFNISATTERSIIVSQPLSLTFSGTVSSSNSNAVFVLQAGSNVCFKDITIDCPSAQFVAQFVGEGSNITFAENVSYSNINSTDSTYFVEFKQNNSISAENCNTNLKVLLNDFQIENELIVECTSEFKDFVKIYSQDTDDYFNVVSFINSRPGMVATSYIRFEFDLNGGYYSSLGVTNFTRDETTKKYIITYAYGTYASGLIDFENQGNAVKSLSTFEGIYGTIQVNGTNYYFDLQMLQNYLAAGRGLSSVPQYFATSLDDVDQNFSIRYYSSASREDLEYFLHTQFFRDNGLRPSYIFKWSVETFTIDFVTDCETTLDPITLEFGQTIPKFTSLSKEGYDFDGWYTNSAKTVRWAATTMPAQNVTLWAKWVEKSYVINFHTSGGSSLPPKTFLFGEDIELNDVNPVWEGYTFEGWYTDSGTQHKFDLKTMPAENLDLYAKWSKIICYVYLHSNASNSSYAVSVEYGSILADNSDVTPRNETGYTFEGFYTDKTYTTEFDMNQVVKENIHIYCKYTPIEYTITFLINYDGQNPDSITAHYGDEIQLPKPTRKEYIFVGWFETSSENETAASFTRMPARNITLSARWTMKQAIDVTFEPQTYTYNGLQYSYQNRSELTGLTFYYLVDEEWTLDAPTELGVYDVKVVRAEDSNFLALEKVIKGGFVICQKETNLTWLIAALYIFTIFEIGVSLLARIMLKRKLSATFVMIGTILVSKAQFVNLIISGLMCLAGFVFMVYQLVVLSRTISNENFTPSQSDNRARFKEDLKFQTDAKNRELDFETKTKTDESFGNKYSENDIEKLLNNDDFTSKIKESRGKFADFSEQPEEEEDNNRYSNFSDEAKDSDETPDAETEFEATQNADKELEGEDSERENIMPQKHYDIENERKNDSSSNDDASDAGND